MIYGERRNATLAVLLMASVASSRVLAKDKTCLEAFRQLATRAIIRDTTEDDPKGIVDGFFRLPNLIKVKNKGARVAIKPALFPLGLVDGTYHATVNVPLGKISEKFFGKRKTTTFFTETVTFVLAGLALDKYFDDEEEKKIKEDAQKYPKELDHLLQWDFRMASVLLELRSGQISHAEAREKALKIKKVYEKYYSLLEKINSDSLSKEEKVFVLNLFQDLGAIPANYEKLNPKQKTQILDINNNLFYEYQALWQFKFDEREGKLPEFFSNDDLFAQELLNFHIKGKNGKKISEPQLKRLLMREQFAKAVERDLFVTGEDSELPKAIRLEIVDELKIFLK